MWTKLSFGARHSSDFLEPSQLWPTAPSRYWHLGQCDPVSTAGLIFATDGSGGPLSREPRLRQVGYGVVALEVSSPHSVVGSLVGTIPGRQTVPRAEVLLRFSSC